MSRSASLRPLLLIAALLAVAALVFATGCGGDSNDKANGTPGAGQTNEPTGTGARGREDVAPAGAGDATVTAASVTAATGADVDADVSVIGFPDPGLGAWTVDITYDPDVVSAVDCDADTNDGTNVCNKAYADATIRFAGAIAEGLLGDTILGTMTFHCEAAGTSPLELSVDVLADGTLGGPIERPANVGEGTITCT